ARLDRVLRVEPGHGVVEVQANTPWRSLAERLRPGNAQAASLRTTMPTVAESLARNAAGPDGRPTVMHVEGLMLVTPDGELRRVSRRAHRELFALSVGGQGLFGALYSVTLKLDSLARAISEAAPSVSGTGTAPGMRLLLPPERAAAFIADARSRFTEWRIAMQDPTLRHVMQEEETFLRWARREAVFASHQHLAGTASAIRRKHLLQPLGICLPIHRDAQARRVTAAQRLEIEQLIGPHSHPAGKLVPLYFARHDEERVLLQL